MYAYYVIFVAGPINVSILHTGWNDKIVVLKKTTLQLYFKTLLKKSIQVT